MKCRLLFAFLVVSLLIFTLSASARDIVVPAGTLLQCTLNEPNLSSKTVDVGDPVLCHLRGITEFGQQAFPRGSYLIGHIEAEKDPGHFVGKGYMWPAGCLSPTHPPRPNPSANALSRCRKIWNAPNCAMILRDSSPMCPKEA